MIEAAALLLCGAETAESFQPSFSLLDLSLASRGYTSTYRIRRISAILETIFVNKPDTLNTIVAMLRTRVKHAFNPRLSPHVTANRLRL